MKGTVRIVAVRCRDCGADMKASYQASGGEPDGPDWDCTPEQVADFERAICVRCGGSCIAETIHLVHAPKRGDA